MVWGVSSRGQYRDPMKPPDTIVCVDCLGTCHLLSYPPEEGFEPGDIVAYRCKDCLDRWDIELAVEDFEDRTEGHGS